MRDYTQANHAWIGAHAMDSYIAVLKKYAVFTGRATRKEYWMFVLINVIISLVLGFVLKLVLGAFATVLSDLYGLAIVLPAIGVGIRRMHDTNRVGWWILFPIVNLVFY